MGWRFWLNQGAGVQYLVYNSKFYIFVFGLETEFKKIEGK